MATVAAVVVAAGCASGTSLKASSSSCFRAFAPARAAVHNKGSLVQVKRFDAATITKQLPARLELAQGEYCSISFKGEYKKGEIELAKDPFRGDGHFAVVLVSTRGYKAVAALIFDKLPTRFGGG